MEVARLALLGLLLIAQVASGPVEAAGEGVRAGIAHVGDEAAYARPGGSEPVLGFRWLPASETRDRWGGPRLAHVLGVVQPAWPADLDAPRGAWAETREAYAGDLVWRLRADNATQQGSAPWPATGLVGDRARERNATLTAYADAPHVRSCLAHHGVQGRLLDVRPPPVGRWCPALAERAAAEPVGGEGTTFRGRAAVAWAYRLHAAEPAGGDVPLPPGGALRVVLADGLPYVAALQVTDPDGEVAWAVELLGYEPGHGDPVPPWVPAHAVQPERRVGAEFAPLREDGPPDGGSGLPYTLPEALFRLRSDPKLGGFQAWERSHPDAFVLRAELTLGSEGAAGAPLTHDAVAVAFAEWRVEVAAPLGGDDFDVYALASRREERQGTPPVLGQPVALVSNREAGHGVRSVPGARSPAGEDALTVASALRAWSEQAPPEGRGWPTGIVGYDAPSSRGPTALWVGAAERGTTERVAVELRDPNVERAVFHWTAVVGARFDAATGAASLLWDAREIELQQAVGLGVRPLQPAAATASLGAAPPRVVGLDLVGAAAASAALLLLAHGGYLTALYSRLAGSGLLDHPVRRRAHELVRAQPGIHFHAVRAALGIGTGAAMYHLGVLERGGLVTHQRLPGFKRYYVSGAVPWGGMRAAAELESASSRAV